VSAFLSISTNKIKVNQIKKMLLINFCYGCGMKKETVDLPNEEKLVFLKNQSILFKKKKATKHSDFFINKQGLVGVQLTDELKKKGEGRDLAKVLSLPIGQEQFVKIKERKLKQISFFPLAKFNQDSKEVLLIILNGGSQFRNNSIIKFNEFDKSEWCQALVVLEDKLILVAKNLTIHEFLGAIQITKTDYFVSKEEIDKYIKIKKGNIDVVFTKIKEMLSGDKSNKINFQ
jgi:hypothetical protein